MFLICEVFIIIWKYPRPKGSIALLLEAENIDLEKSLFVTLFPFCHFSIAFLVCNRQTNQPLKTN